MPLSDRLMIEVRNMVPGTIDPQIKDVIWTTIQDLCRDAWVWRENLDITLVAGQDEYSVAPVGTEVIYIESAVHPTLDTYGFVQGVGGELILKNIPLAVHTPDKITVRVVLAPSLDVGANVDTLIPEDMWWEHHQVLVHGVVGRLMAMPAKPFSNPQMAPYHLRSYRGMKAEARRKAQAGPVPGAQTWRFPRWANNRRLR